MSEAALREHRDRVGRVDRRLVALAPAAGSPYPCPYRPGFAARAVTLQTAALAPGVYHAFLDLNYRRLGAYLYRPACDTCQSCVQIRVPVAGFTPSRSQRRCVAANADLDATIAAPEATEEKRDLYARYLEARHDGSMDGSWEEFASFLYTTCVDTREVTFRLEGRVVAVGIMDAEPLALSAAYCYFDPSLASRSLGVFNILWLIAEARRTARPYVYLGYYVSEADTMKYKAEYRPCEVWRGGEWRTP